jgi:hypothetical protein
MNEKTQQIINFLDENLTKEKRFSYSAVEANALLSQAGILRDSDSRPGKPLRDILRAGKIPHAYQVGKNWVIPHSREK